MLSKKEEMEFIEYMINNKPLEEKVSELSERPDDILALQEFIAYLVASENAQKGLILGVESTSDMPKGKLSLFKQQQLGMPYVATSDKKRYSMIFTSQDSFGLFPELHGCVYFVKEMIHALAEKDSVDGIVVNYESENEIYLSKEQLIIADLYLYH